MPFSYQAYYFILSVGSLIGLYQWRKINRPGRKLVVIVLFTLLVQGTSAILNYYFDIIFPWDYTAYALISSMLYAWLYFEIISSKLVKRIILWVGIFYALFNAIWLFTHLENENFPSEVVSVYGVVLVAFSLLYFTNTLRNPSSQELHLQFLFWMNVGVLLYWTMDFAYLSLVDRVGEGDIKLRWIAKLQIWSSNVYYAILAVCIWMSAKYPLKRSNGEL